MEKNKRGIVSEIIKRKRVQFGWSQNELADKVGISWITIQRFEKGKFNLNGDILYKIFEVLDIDFQLDGEVI